MFLSNLCLCTNITNALLEQMTAKICIETYVKCCCRRTCNWKKWLSKICIYIGIKDALVKQLIVQSRCVCICLQCREVDGTDCSQRYVCIRSEDVLLTEMIVKYRVFKICMYAKLYCYNRRVSQKYKFLSSRICCWNSCFNWLLNTLHRMYVLLNKL